MKTAAVSGVKLMFVFILEAEDALLSCSRGYRISFYLSNATLPFPSCSTLGVQSREDCKDRTGEFYFPQ